MEPARHSLASRGIKTRGLSKKLTHSRFVSGPLFRLHITELEDGRTVLSKYYSSKADAESAKRLFFSVKIDEMNLSKRAKENIDDWLYQLGPEEGASKKEDLERMHENFSVSIYKKGSHDEEEDEEE